MIAITVLPGVGSITYGSNVDCCPLFMMPTFESGMRAHADYMRANRTLTHHQDPQRPKASPEGGLLARPSNVTSQARSYQESTAEFLLTLFHRDGMLAPELRASAMVNRHGFGLVDVRTHMDSPMRGGILIFLPMGYQEAPTQFARGERPHPISPRHNRKRLGPPIGLYQQQLWFAKGFAQEPELSVFFTG